VVEDEVKIGSGYIIITRVCARDNSMTNRLIAKKLVSEFLWYIGAWVRVHVRKQETHYSNKKASRELGAWANPNPRCMASRRLTQETREGKFSKRVINL